MTTWTTTVRTARAVRLTVLLGALLTAFTLLLGLVGCAGGGPQSATTAPSTPPATTTPPATMHHRTGDTVAIGGSSSYLAITVNEVSSLTGYEKTGLTNGDKVALMNITVKNTSGQELPVSKNSFLLRDMTGQVMPSYYLSAGQPAVLEGPVSPGEQIRGTVAFDVPEDSHTYTLHYVQTSEAQTIWDITVP